MYIKRYGRYYKIYKVKLGKNGKKHFYVRNGKRLYVDQKEVLPGKKPGMVPKRRRK